MLGVIPGKVSFEIGDRLVVIQESPGIRRGAFDGAEKAASMNGLAARDRRQLPQLADLSSWEGNVFTRAVHSRQRIFSKKWFVGASRHRHTDAVRKIICRGTLSASAPWRRPRCCSRVRSDEDSRTSLIWKSSRRFQSTASRSPGRKYFSRRRVWRAPG